MTSIPQPSDLTDSYDATWDAWHRLVKLEDGAATVAVYEYDGNNRRIIKQVYTAGSLDETRQVYYTSQSQAIEERVDSSTDAEIQFVWNLGYVDDLVLRDRDTTANGALDERLYSLPDLRFSVMALANTSGTILERFKYDGHGKTSVLSDLFASRSSSLYDWEFRYTGRREDLETGLLFFRARYYSAELGRFISRDPLGFVDGMSLYRAYFVPGAVDPFGLESQAECTRNCLANPPLVLLPSAVPGYCRNLCKDKPNNCHAFTCDQPGTFPNGGNDSWTTCQKDPRGFVPYVSSSVIAVRKALSDKGCKFVGKADCSAKKGCVKLYLKKFPAVADADIRKILEKQFPSFTPEQIADAIKKVGAGVRDCHYASHTAKIDCDTGTCKHIPGIGQDLEDEGPGFGEPDRIYANSDTAEFWECECPKEK